MNRYALLFLLLVACVVLGIQCRDKEALPPPTPQEKQIKAKQAVASVTVKTIRIGPVYKAYTAVGIIAPRDFARISPKVNGRIESIAVEEGDRIDKGALLMKIDAFDYQRILENTTAEYNKANVNREKAMRDFSRLERLYRDRTVSQQRYHDMKTTAELAEYAYRQSRVALKKAQRNLKECRLTAPISGIVTDRHVNEGELTGSHIVAFVIMQMDQVEVAVDMPEDAYRHIRAGNRCQVTVDALPDDTFSGAITRIHPIIDPASRTAKITVTLDNPRLRLRSGMTARAKVIQQVRDKALQAPAAAFVKGEEGYFVYKYMSGRVKRTPVAIGVRGDGITEIIAGPESGDQIVIDGLVGLRDGMAVNAKE